MTAVEVIDELLRRNVTFAAFREPGQPARVWIQREHLPALIEAQELDREQRAFVMAPFISQLGHVHIIRGDVDLLLDNATPSDLPTEAGPLMKLRKAKEASPEQYMAGVDEIKAGIGTGALRKAVLARTRVHHNPVDLPRSFFDALRVYPDAMVILAHTPLHGTWIGASPERLIHFDGNRFIVDSLAATMPADTASDSATQWGEKERIEHAVVTERILAQLEGMSIHATASERTVKRTGKLAHLHAVVSGEWQGPRGKAPLLLHPTPAVCGEPVFEAQELIARLEPDPRGLYAGYWGPWRAEGRCNLYVNIRCMEQVEAGMAIHVGAGIVGGSDPQAEWAETELKARTWLDLIEAQRAVG